MVLPFPVPFFIKPTVSLNGTVTFNLPGRRGPRGPTSDGQQRALVRADLLIKPGHLESTSFQMELLPSGQLCRGQVTAVHSYGFEARCNTPDGSRRYVHAEWQPAEGSTLQGGLIRVHA